MIDRPARPLSHLDSALIVRSPYAHWIASGFKTWEMRSAKTNKRGRFALIVQGSGLIIGEFDLIDCGESISLKDAGLFSRYHRVEDLSLLEKWNTPWVLANAELYSHPIPYTHPRGAVIWVDLNKAL